MKNREFTLQDIKEMVQQGIVASKQSESEFYGRWENWRKNKDARDQIMHDDILLIKTEVTSLKEKVSIQNGRVTKNEEKTEKLEKRLDKYFYLVIGGVFVIEVIMRFIKI